ncbi:hypothetical protein [Nocardia nova]|uniref:hypothetical protein n=1 Tax=Nocardia nova TaxID=37330 RepID=UPI0033E98D3D
MVIQRDSLWDKDSDADDGTSTPGIVDRTGSNPGQGLRRRPKQQRDSRIAGRVAGVAIVAAVTVVVVVVILTTIHAGRRHTRMSTPPPSSAPATPAVDPHATDRCRQSVAGLSVSGTGSGDTRTGPGVILAFNRAYYVTRTGADAATFLAPDAEGITRDGSRYPLTPGGLQAGIDKTPADTRYCVSIEPDSDRWQIEITEQVGYEITAITHELVTTATHDGRTLITTITQP